MNYFLINFVFGELAIAIPIIIGCIVALTIHKLSEMTK